MKLFLVYFHCKNRAGDDCTMKFAAMARSSDAAIKVVEDAYDFTGLNIRGCVWSTIKQNADVVLVFSEVKVGETSPGPRFSPEGHHCLKCGFPLDFENQRCPSCGYRSRPVGNNHYEV